MAVKKRKRAKRRKLKRVKARPLYKTTIAITKHGKTVREVVALSTDKRSGLWQFKQASKDHGGYVSLEETKVIKERLPKD